MRVHHTLSRIFLLTAWATSLSLLPIGAEAGAPRCFLHGIIKPLDKEEKASLSDMIRLKFDIDKPEQQGKCEQMLESYCVNHVKKKNYSPGLLKASFKPDVDKVDETTYHFTPKCVLETD